MMQRKTLYISEEDLSMVKRLLVEKIYILLESQKWFDFEIGNVFQYTIFFFCNLLLWLQSYEVYKFKSMLGINTYIETVW